MGRQFLVNQYQNNWQRESDVLALPGGGFMVVWSSYVNNYDDGFAGTVISGRRFDAAGRPTTNEFIIDAVDGTASQNPSITALAGGGYAVASAFSPTDDILGATQAWVRHYNANGTPRGPDSRVDTPTPAEEQYQAAEPEVAGLAGGGSLIFYAAEQSDATFDDIYVRRFDAQGRPVGLDQVVNTVVRNRDQLEPEAATLRNGNVVVIWNSEDTLPAPGGGLDYEIRASLYSSSGALIRGDFHLTRNIGVPSPYPGLSGDFDVTPLVGGGFAISRFDYGNRFGRGDDGVLIYQAFGAAGRAATGPVIVHQTSEVQFDSQVVQLATGEIVMIWEQYPLNDAVGPDIYGRVLTASGRPLTGVFQVGENFNGYDVQEDPSLAALAGGGFVVTYTHDNLDADNEAVAARVFGQGTAGRDVLTVDASGYVNGGAGDDRLTGDARANGLAGGAGNDVMKGGAGADVLMGRTGRDHLEGGAGADQFVFDTGPGAADVIYGFDASDIVVIENALFAGIGPAGRLAAGAFRVLGSGAVEASDRVLYNAQNGNLFVDVDGSGRAAPVLVAQVLGAPAMSAADVLII